VGLTDYNYPKFITSLRPGKMCYVCVKISLPIPMAAQSKALVYDRSLTGIVGLNPA
jgi:hypothetical protein